MISRQDIPFSKTHNLKDLLSLIVPTIPAWQAWHEDFSSFTTHAVDLRYPGEFATAEDQRMLWGSVLRFVKPFVPN